MKKKLLSISLGLLAFGATSSDCFGQLYTFTSHTFTNAGVTGKDGPILAECQTAYSAETWEMNPAYFNMGTQGIQRWIVPATGTYEVDAYGAQGGDDTYTVAPEVGGLGSKMTGTFSLTEGDTLYILVGQKGEDTRVSGANNAAPGGGGGTFVWLPTNLTNPLLAAGGGGGGSGKGHAGREAVTTIDGQNSAVTANAGLAGNGGRSNSGGDSYWAGGGAGWLTNGTGGDNSADYDYLPGIEGAEGGRTPLNGGIGGVRYQDGADEGGDGGFGGGGGGGSDNMGTGGGGGYSGGGGDRGTSNSSGGGGGSFNSGTSQANVAATNTGMGYVVVTYICPAIDITTTSALTTITSNNTTASTYQWIDCNLGNAIIAGATSVDYTAVANGDYAVIITEGVCSDTSACVNVSTVGINNYVLGAEVTLYPNPTTNDITLDLGAAVNAQVSIVNVTGMVVYNLETLNAGKNKISLTNFSKGVYFVKIQSENQQKVIKVIKQ